MPTSYNVELPDVTYFTRQETATYSDAGAGINFQSAQVTSATFDEVAHSVTLKGLGTDNGLCVAFTIVAVDSSLMPQGCSASLLVTASATMATCAMEALPSTRWNSVDRIGNQRTLHSKKCGDRQCRAPIERSYAVTGAL